MAEGREDRRRRMLLYGEQWAAGGRGADGEGEGDGVAESHSASAAGSEERRRQGGIF